MRTIEISEKAFQVIERLRRSKGMTRTEALETLVQEGATIAQIEQLGCLRDKGRITDDEFLAKKQELLSRL